VITRKLFAQIARYVTGSAASALFALCLPLFLHHVVGVEARLAAACGLVAATLLNFCIARFFVFSGGGSGGSLRQSLGRYAISVISFRSFEYALFVFLFDIWHLPYAAALGLPLVVSTILKFFIYRSFVFRTDRPEKA